MLRWFGRGLALALLLAALPVTAADFTKTYPLTSTSTWTPIGTPPFDLQANGGDIEVFQADATPSTAARGQVLRNLAPPKSFTSAQAMYARLASSSSATAITTPSTAATGGTGGSGTGGGAIYGSDAAGAAPTKPPVLGAFLDPAGNVKTPALDATGRLPVTAPDIRATGTFSAGQTVDIPINGAATAGLRFSGLTASASTLSFSTTNDGGTTFSSKNTVNCGTGNGTSTYTADGQPRIDVAGATGLRIISTGGSGTISYASNLSAAPLACPNGPTPTGTNPIGSITNTGFGITGTLPAFAAVPTFNIGSLNGAATDASVLQVKTTLGSPFQAGGLIGNTSFGISGALPAFAAVPAFKIDHTTPGTTDRVVSDQGAAGTAPWSVVQQDGAKAILSTAGGTSTPFTTISSSDANFPVVNASTGWFSTNGYASAILDVPSTGTGNTFVVQFSSDGGTTARQSAAIFQGGNNATGPTVGAISQVTASRIPIEGQLMRIVELTAGATPAASVAVTMKVANLPLPATYSRSVEVGSSSTSDAITASVNQSGTSQTAKSTAGVLYSAYSVCPTAPAAQQYLVIIDRAAPPAAGNNITPLEVAKFDSASAAGASAAINYGAGPARAFASAGVTALITTSLTTYTAGTACFINVGYR